MKQAFAASLVLVVVALLTAGVVLWRYDPAQYRLYPRCQLYALTGLQCPGCGGLRALHALLHGRVSEAFRLNPLFVAGGPAALGLAGWWLLRKWRRPDAPVELPAGWSWAVVALVLAFGLLRNVPAVATWWRGP